MSTVQGVGVDVVDVQRLKEVLRTQGETFTKKIFTTTEAEYCLSRKNPHENFAARFAAKEAVAKAMRTGWSGSFRWKDVEVVNEPSGAPVVNLYGEVARALRGSLLHLSMSHTENTVVAFVVIEKNVQNRKRKETKSVRKKKTTRSVRTRKK